jgi:signal transduction histidine kinase/ligand-binding sensor domain-containing protein
MFHRRPASFSVYGALLAFAFLLWSGDVFASVFNIAGYSIQNWQIEDGLPQNAVTSVVQARNGYLWVGTYSGLARFDGVQFTVFDENNTPELHDSRVTSLFEADDGKLWIGHENGGVTSYQDGRFHAVNYNANRSGGKIVDIGTDQAGAVWLLNQQGLLTRLKDGLVLTPSAGTATNVVDMTRSKQGSIWVARDGRVSLLDHGRLRPLQFADANSNNYVQGISASRDGGLWVACDGHIKKWKDNHWLDDLGQFPWGQSPLSKLIETKSGILLAGTTDYGLYLIFPDHPQSPLCFNQAAGFPSDWIISLLQDREGNFWAGTGGGGLIKMRKSFANAIEPPDHWQGRAVLCAKSGQDGALWIGTEGAGLYRLQNGKWKNYGTKDGISNPYVWSVAEDKNGELWASTWSGGLFVRRGEHFISAPGLEQIMTPMPATFCAGPDKLWVGTGDGLLLYDSGQVTWLGKTNSVARASIRCIIEDANGAVWFGTSGDGLGGLKNGKLQQFRKSDGLASDYIECLHLDSDGTLWVGTFGGGLSRLKKGHFASIGKKQGLPNNIVCDIEDDGNGFFWMSSHDGIIRVSKAELNRCADGKISEVSCTAYGLSDGLPTLECSEGRGCKTADGKLWFPTTKGLVNLNPRDIPFNPLPPPVVIEAMLVDDQIVTNKLSADTFLQIPPGRHQFEFQYAGLSFTAPEKVQFKYRLNGFETAWVNAGTRRVANYNYIPPGKYAFQVIACNNDGVWNDTGAEIGFVVLPFFWQTLWFHLLVGAGIIAASGGLVWFDTRRRMRRKLERIERQRDIERERARIAHDIHDDLGSQLTRITMLSESAREGLNDPHRAAAGLNQIYDTARELTRAMDEIVWAVNPRHDTLESLAGYLERFAQDLLAAADIRCRLDFPVQFPEWRLTAEVRHNVFLAFKESLHNIVRHAAASEVRISLVPGAASFELIIEDNGHGFARQNNAGNLSEDANRFSSGNGLENMTRRLTEIGGHCSIQSASERGTKVTFKVPLKLMPV